MSTPSKLNPTEQEQQTDEVNVTDERVMKDEHESTYVDDMVMNDDHQVDAVDDWVANDWHEVDEAVMIDNHKVNGIDQMAIKVDQKVHVVDEKDMNDECDINCIDETAMKDDNEIRFIEKTATNDDNKVHFIHKAATNNKFIDETDMSNDHHINYLGKIDMNDEHEVHVIDESEMNNDHDDFDEFDGTSEMLNTSMLTTSTANLTECEVEATKAFERKNDASLLTTSTTSSNGEEDSLQSCPRNQIRSSSQANHGTNKKGEDEVYSMHGTTATRSNTTAPRTVSNTWLIVVIIVLLAVLVALVVSIRTGTMTGNSKLLLKSSRSEDDHRARLTKGPTEPPSAQPTQAPSTSPSMQPSSHPSQEPSKSPTSTPSSEPSKSPTLEPTKSPTAGPTKLPTAGPTKSPTSKPTESPTSKPTESPTSKLTESPTSKLTESPTSKPTESPTSKPTESPTSKSTGSPTKAPTTESPTAAPANSTSSASSTIPSDVTYIPGNLTTLKLGLLLSEGLDARLLATTGQRVRYFDGNRSSLAFHGQPDGGATFPDERPSNRGGWVYVSNSEMPDVGDGGVGAITFDKHNRVLNYEMVLKGTSMNCGGGRTPWNTWASCEEIEFDGLIYQVDPFGVRDPEVMTLGSDGGRWESFAYDVRNKTRPHFFATEDHNKGTVRRFTPNNPDWDSPWDMLHGNGVTDYLIVHPNDINDGGTFEWSNNLNDARNNARTYYPQTEGIDVYNSRMFVVCKNLYQMFIFDLDDMTYTNMTTKSGLFDGKPDNLRRIMPERESNANVLLYFTEEGGRDAGVHARDRQGRFYTIFESPVYTDETTGLAFSPDGKYMYIAYQANGKLFSLWRKDGYAFQNAHLDIKYHQANSG